MRLLRDHDSSRFLFLQPADYPGDKGNSRAKFSAFEDEFEFEHEERLLRFGAASQRDSENKGAIGTGNKGAIGTGRMSIIEGTIIEGTGP
jgi:hypothetical protein